MYYQYDSRLKNVLIRTAKGRFPEILHKGDKQWSILAPKPDDPDEMYTRAVYLGSGCWERLDDVEEDEAEAILKEWGYEAVPPEADDVLIPKKEADDISDNIGLFEGKLKKIRIDSNCICYGPCPKEDDETEQHLTINSEGGVWMTRLSFGKGLIEKTKFKIEAETAKNLLEAIEKRFSQDYELYFVTDIGSWEMILTNEEGREFRYSGPLMEGDGDVTKGLSDMTRRALGRDDLFVFDGCHDKIDNIKIEYYRETKIKPKELSEGAKYEFVTWSYSEILTIDRATETLTNHIQFAEQCSVTNTYHVEEGISSLLDDLYPEMFEDVQGNPPEAIDDPMEQRKYKITVITNHGDEIVTEGTFDKLGLPDEYPEFIEKIYDFMAFYGIGELFERKSYEKTKRTSTDYIFCDVEFEPGGKTYCYLADDDTYEVGDTVLVPAGHDNHEALVRIVDKNYYSKENAPFPVDKAKWIIKRIDEDEIDQYLNTDN